MDRATIRTSAPLRSTCTYVEMDGQHSGFLRLRVKVSRAAADRIEQHCRAHGLHSMVYFRDCFDDALTELLADLTPDDKRTDLDDHDAGF